MQAGGGIRDFCLSRGLGDVYRRQVCVIDLEPAVGSEVVRPGERRAGAVGTVCDESARVLDISLTSANTNGRRSLLTMMLRALLDDAGAQPKCFTTKQR